MASVPPHVCICSLVVVSIFASKWVLAVVNGQDWDYFVNDWVKECNMHVTLYGAKFE